MSPDRTLPGTRSLLIHGGGAGLFVEMAGSGPTIVMIHGWPLDRRSFALQIPALSKHFKVVVFDRRGFGRSGGKPDLRLELDDIDRILDKLTDDPAHVLGMSQGGRIALRYAVTRPERLRSLILQGAMVDGLDVGGTRDERIPIAEYAALARQGKMNEVRRRWLQHPMMALGTEHHEAARLLERIMRDYSGSDLMEFTPESYHFPIDVLDGAARVRIPTLILTGARETETRRQHAAKLLATMPDAREIIFRDSGHLSNLTEPARYNSAVIRFCESVDTATANSNGFAED